MPRFIVLGKLTDKAIEKMKEAKERDEKAEQIIISAGGENSSAITIPLAAKIS